MTTNSSRRSGANRPPKYSRQKEKGRADRAYIWLDDKKIMLGRYGSAESREKYNELIAPKSETEPETPSPTTVSELIVADRPRFPPKRGRSHNWPFGCS
jgi:hypothetical protein